MSNRDYKVPKTVKLTNETNLDATILYRSINIDIKVKDEVTVEIKNSDELARVMEQANFMGLKAEVGEGPEPEPQPEPINPRQETEVENITDTVANINTKFYNKTTNKTITPADPEFSDDLYVVVGKVSNEPVEVTDDTTITINGREYNHTVRRTSIGKNSFIEAPVFNIKEDGTLEVSTLHLVAESNNGVTVVKYGNITMTVALDGVTAGGTLEIENVYALDTKSGKTNTVEVSGNTITQTSGDGRHIMGVVLSANGEDILDTSEVIYRLDTTGNMGFTTPETLSGQAVTYAKYMKYKNGAYTQEDAGTYTTECKLYINGKGSINLTLVLNAIAE